MAQENGKNVDLDLEALVNEDDFTMAQEKQLVTGEMVHNAFASVYRTAQPWINLSQEQVVNYGIMAEYLNDALKLAQATQEPGYVWSAEEE